MFSLVVVWFFFVVVYRGECDKVNVYISNYLVVFVLILLFFLLFLVGLVFFIDCVMNVLLVFLVDVCLLILIGSLLFILMFLMVGFGVVLFYVNCFYIISLI